MCFIKSYYESQGWIPLHCTKPTWRGWKWLHILEIMVPHFRIAGTQRVASESFIPESFGDPQTCDWSPAFQLRTATILVAFEGLQVHLRHSDNVTVANEKCHQAVWLWSRQLAGVDFRVRTCSVLVDMGMDEFGHMWTDQSDKNCGWGKPKTLLGFCLCGVYVHGLPTSRGWVWWHND